MVGAGPPPFWARKPRLYITNSRAALTNSFISNGSELSLPAGMKLKDATSALERQIIYQVLERNKNNISRTALELGLSRRGLRLKLNQLGLAKDDEN